MNLIKHYVCSECGMTSKNVGTCQTDDCVQQGMALIECHCQDGKHESVLHVWSDDKEAPESQAQNITTLDLDNES